MTLPLKACKPSSKSGRRTGVIKNDAAKRRHGEWYRLHSRASRGVQRTARPTVTAVNTAMTLTLQELATTSGGELIGDPSLQITGAASLAEATPGEISFFGNPKYIHLLRKTRASAVFVPPKFVEPI